MPATSAPRYQAPGRLTRSLVNPLANRLSRRGVSIAGSRLLEVRGRSSGEWRATTVNPLELDGRRYLVAPRGETQWVRNLRAAGEGRLRLGGRVERFRATELPDGDKPDVLRAYLRRWRWEVGVFFDGIGPDADDDELRAAAARHPVFLVEAVGTVEG